MYYILLYHTGFKSLYNQRYQNHPAWKEGLKRAYNKAYNKDSQQNVCKIFITYFFYWFVHLHSPLLPYTDFLAQYLLSLFTDKKVDDFLQI